MASYQYKDKIELTFDANKRRLRAEGNIILQALMNEALNEMAREFQAALGRGEILSIGGTQEEMKRFLGVAAHRHLGLPAPVFVGAPTTDADTPSVAEGDSQRPIGFSARAAGHAGAE